MTTHYRTKALILGKRDFREADRFFTFFTKEFGRIEAMAKAERKIKSKLRGGLELFYLSEIEFIQGRNWKTLVDASLVNDFRGIHNNLSSLKAAYGVAEVFDSLVKGQEKDLEIWEVLEETLQKLSEEKSPFLVFQYFFWNFIGILGYWPQLYQCAGCNSELSEGKLYFSPARGGLVCESCIDNTDNPKRVDSDVIKVLRLILEEDYSSLEQLKLSENHRENLADISNFSFHSLKNL